MICGKLAEFLYLFNNSSYKAITMKASLKIMYLAGCLSLMLFIQTPSSLVAQNNDSILLKEISSLKSMIKNTSHTYDQIIKKVDDLMWRDMLGDIAFVDKVRLTGPPRWKAKKKDDKFAANPLQFYTYVFVPKNINTTKKYPLIVLPHSGVHADFSTYYAHIVRELIAQGYIVVSAEYRGSTGYGKDTYENIDYGGLENEDVLTSRDYMVENYSFVDKDNIGIIGWSHGGMISLMNILRYPEKYKCAFAGVPVSDLDNRLASHEPDYTENFTDSYHIGESIKENPAEYKRRSPSTYAKDLKRPTTRHLNTKYLKKHQGGTASIESILRRQQIYGLLFINFLRST